MIKHYIVSLAVAAATLLPLSAAGQVLVPHRVDNSKPVVLGQQGRAPKAVKVRQLLYGNRLPNGNPTIIPSAPQRQSAKANVRGNMKRTPTNAPELYVNMVASDAWEQGSEQYGVYSMVAKYPLYLTQMVENSYASYYGTGNAGGAMVDGVYYVADMSDPWGTGSYTCNILAFNLETGSLDFMNTKMYVDMSLCGTDWAQDGPGGAVYGQFYNSDGSALQFGKLDLDNSERTTISTCQRHYVALGIATDGYMYGVSNDGNLYKIDKTTGSETLVGPTGVAVANSQGEYFYQTGEIDQRTNTFYWASCDSLGHSALRTVDLTTGKATKIADFDNDEFLTGMVVPAVSSETGAPARPSDLDVNFAGTSLSGTVSFKAPDKTVGGAAITDTLACTISIDGETAATLRVMAGQTGSTTVTVSSTGLHTFEVYASNAAGSGPSIKNTLYLGQDTPRLSGSASATLLGTDTVVVSWRPFTEGKHHGTLGEVKYDVVRYPEGKTIATGLADTTFTDAAIPVSQMQSMRYGIRMTGATGQDAEQKTNKVLVGYAFEPPYKAEFTTDSLVSDYFTVIDANNDFRITPMGSYETLYSGGWAQADGLATYYSSYWNQADDWLITPPVRLEAGKIYSLTFNAGGQYATNERMEVKCGTANTVAAMTVQVMPSTNISTTTYQEFSYLVRPQADGRYYFGFHAISDANQGWLSLKDISVVGFDSKAPGTPTVVALKAAAKGEKQMDITFRAPSVCVDSTALSAISYVVVGMNNTERDTVSSPTPGQEYTVRMPFATDGMQNITVTAYNDAGEGLPANAQAWGGLDVPVAPTAVKLADAGKNLKMTWEAVADTGVHGGYVDVAAVKYNVYKINQTYYGTYPTLVDSLGNTLEATINVDPTTGSQDLVRYGVAARNGVGEGDKATSNGVVVGKPYTLPMVESAPQTNTSYLWWLTSEGTKNWGLNTSVSADGDGCCFAYVPAKAGDKAWLNSGKISFRGATNPAIVLYCANGSAQSGNKLIAQVQYPDGHIVDADTVDMNMTYWTRKILDLPADIANEDYVIVKFLGLAGSSNFMVIDDIEIRDLKPNDLAATFSKSQTLTKGQRSQVEVVVSNLGRSAATGYTVSLSANGRQIGSVQVSDTLAMLESTTVGFSYTPSVLIDEDSVSLKATIAYATDVYTANNQAKLACALSDNNLPTPRNVTTCRQPNGTQEVKWTAPESGNVTTTDDFESYTPWATTVNGWTMVDGDKGQTNPLWSSIATPNQYTPFAFEVFNIANLGADPTRNPSFASHSGNQHLAAIYSRSNDRGVDQDNWLISSQLSGKAQTISFYCRNLKYSSTDYPEHISVMASATTADTVAFTAVCDTTISGGEWQLISVSLPEGTQYFAIRHDTKAQNAFVFCIDDVTFERSLGEPVAYNVYVEGERIGTVEAGATLFVEAARTGNTPTYYVSAVYADGESMAVPAELTTGITTVLDATATTFDLYTVDGKLVARGKSNLSGVKPGVYVARSGGKAVKLIVK